VTPRAVRLERASERMTLARPHDYECPKFNAAAWTNLFTFHNNGLSRKYSVVNYLLFQITPSGCSITMSRKTRWIDDRLDRELMLSRAEYSVPICSSRRDLFVKDACDEILPRIISLWWNIATMLFSIGKFSPFVSKGFSDSRYTLRIYFRFTVTTAVTWKKRFWEFIEVNPYPIMGFRVRSNSIHGSFSEFLRFFPFLKKVWWCLYGTERPKSSISL